ncbi:MAG: polyisoprenoid-binding protein [Phycisphaerales bacterium]|nr:polyisoprenoid-binding protein [Phycisphaerales bacterium]
MQLSIIALPIFLLAATPFVNFPQATPPAAPATTAPAPAQAQGGDFKIDDTHSCSLFRVQHLHAGQFWGRFNNIAGTFTLSTDPAKMKFDVSIETDSVDTGNAKLDGHLKSTDFFNTKEFPAMTFKSTGCTKIDDDHFALSGDLTMHGVTKSVSTVIEVTGWGFDTGKGARAGAEAKFKINRSDFGVSYGVENGALGNETTIIVGLEGIAA